MKKLMYAVMLLLGMSITVSGVAQNNDVYSIVEEMPEYPGGMDKLVEYLSQNIKYPQQAIEKGIEGKVFVSFIVEKDGSVSNVQVQRSLGGGCDEEAVRVVKAMPKWKPGKQDGKPVRVRYNLPINFRLQDQPQPKQIEIVEDDVEVEDIEISFDINTDEVIDDIVWKDDDELYIVVEEMPEYPGGMKALNEYLAKNIKYPQTALENGIQGKVFVSFIVEKDGSVSNVQVQRSLGGGCDEEAVRVVKAMPKWKPGKQRGKTVRVSYTLPVNFKL